MVNHIDEVRDNNCIDNLEWCTAQQNVEHSCANWYYVKSPFGEIVKIFNLSKFCKENKLDQGCMSRVLNKIQDNHKGWKVWAT